MATKLYVGNLNYNATDADLRTLFAAHGTVQSVDIIRDRYTGQAKGFAFIEMSSAEEAQKALELNGNDFMGRKINVSEARPQEKRPGGGGGRDNDRRGGGGFRGGNRQSSKW